LQPSNAKNKSGVWTSKEPLKIIGSQIKNCIRRIKMIRPLGDKILVKPSQPKEVKKGGIIIPDTAKEKPQEGEVIAVGTGKKTEEGKTIALDIKKGDKVLYGKYSGTEVKFDDEEYLIMSQDDVLGIIE
jgi:chaperonin GroES